MAKNSISDWDTTASNNSDVGGINIAENCAAANINNAIREMMAQVATLDPTGRFQYEPTVSTGSSNAFVLTTGKVSALSDMLRLSFRANFSNTGACTLNVDAIGAADLKIYKSTGIDDPASGQIQSGSVYDVVYIDALSDFVVLNPTPIPDLSSDTTPQLGGDLDTNSHAVFWSKGADVASATELLVLTDGNSFDVTGTTTITSIETTADAFGIGSIIQLQFDEALTITHHATDLILPNAANITTVAGDVGLFQKYAAGDWRCVSYQPSNVPVRGRTIQMVNLMDGAVATGTTNIPTDNSKPQNTEGDEYMTLAITPTSATNKLKIDVVFYYGVNKSTTATGALFQDSTSDALAAAGQGFPSSGNQTMSFTHYMTAGTVAETTFKVRAGGTNTATITFNGDSSTRNYGGIAASSMTITEISA